VARKNLIQRNRLVQKIFGFLIYLNQSGEFVIERFLVKAKCGEIRGA
jgi:hypothetical protein